MTTDTAVAPHSSSFWKLNYLNAETEGMTYAEKVSVHYRIVGAASSWLEEARWQSIVDSSVSAVKAVRP